MKPDTLITGVCLMGYWYQANRTRRRKRRTQRRSKKERTESRQEKEVMKKIKNKHIRVG